MTSHFKICRSVINIGAKRVYVGLNGSTMMERNILINLERNLKTNTDEERLFQSRKKELLLSQSDIDILVYAINHVDWSEYDADEFGGEGIEAAAMHLDDLEMELL